MAAFILRYLKKEGGPPYLTHEVELAVPSPGGWPRMESAVGQLMALKARGKLPGVASGEWNGHILITSSHESHLVAAEEDATRCPASGVPLRKAKMPPLSGPTGGTVSLRCPLCKKPIPTTLGIEAIPPHSWP